MQGRSDTLPVILGTRTVFTMTTQMSMQAEWQTLHHHKIDSIKHT